MTRIRYTKKDSLLVTDLMTVGPNIIVRAVVFPDLHGEILDIQNNTLDYVTGKSTRQVKDLLKKSLVRLGLKVDGEIRNK
jgi:hypothetical protein